MERLYIAYALEQTGGNQQQAAARMGMHRDGLRKAVKRLKIKVERVGQPQSRI